MSSETLWSHELSLPAEMRSVKQAREFVCVHLTEHELSHLLEDVRLVVSELATNAVLHARMTWKLSLSRSDGHVLLTVEDRSAFPLVPVQPEIWDTGGRGLLIVAALTQEWGVDTSTTDEKSVWAAFAVR